MTKTKIAIACQGGGSHTAFTAGVLKALFENNAHNTYEIVGLSGTSGGAVCATLAWYSLLRLKALNDTPETFMNRIVKFWDDNGTQSITEAMLNMILVQYSTYTDCGILPKFQSSPSFLQSKAVSAFAKKLFPGFYDLEYLLNKHIKFDELKDLVTPDSPGLLLGAANVLSGEFKTFRSSSEENQNEISVHSVLASSAIPSLFQAVKIKGTAYWDGLFSANPPVSDLLTIDSTGENKPDQIWVIQINPEKRTVVPTTPEDIIDRRNEMIGNLSLYAQLDEIESYNNKISNNDFSEKYVKEKNLKPVDMFIITMNQELLDSLDYSSKVDRSSQFIKTLIDDGVNQGCLFIKDPESMKYIPRTQKTA